ncbi:hypothetical protein KL86DPRO_10200 [uncultured delta proteobacterium]|uniref:Uncharacterized protein n=1 Tax=uncultured delta proteobacterium TaxID=34034 RepID=A0A212IW86_9DELT|nr:hypothetical protein KL86DPRO_10200 [uncultured delta proteobacterium]
MLPAWRFTLRKVAWRRCFHAHGCIYGGYNRLCHYSLRLSNAGKLYEKVNKTIYIDCDSKYNVTTSSFVKLHGIFLYHKIYKCC